VPVKTLSLSTLLAFLLTASPAAQFGHPLEGSWSGDWGPTAEQRTRILLELDWNGKAITGTINPGSESVPLSKATLDPSNWTVHFEAERKDATGQLVRYDITGKLENIGAYQRFITGTWIEGTRKGSFKVTRN
jgi:hypothetical protein